MYNSAQLSCKCGKTNMWVTDGEEVDGNCPNCGRRYIGKYNPKKYGVEAVEIKPIKTDRLHRWAWIAFHPIKWHKTRNVRNAVGKALEKLEK